MAEQGDAYFAAEEMVGEFACLDGDGGELGDIGIGVERAIGHEDEARFAEVLEVVAGDDRDAENFRHMRQRLDRVEQCAEIGCGQCLISANDGVGMAVLDHECTEVVGLGDEFFRLADAFAAVAGHVFNPLAEKFEVGCFGRIDGVDEGERHAMFGGEGADAIAVAEQDGDDDLFADEAGGGADHADVLAFGKDHAFRVVSQLQEQAVDHRVGGGRRVGRGAHEMCRCLHRGASLVWLGRIIQPDSSSIACQPTTIRTRRCVVTPRDRRRSISMQRLRRA